MKTNNLYVQKYRFSSEFRYKQGSSHQIATLTFTTLVLALSTMSALGAGSAESKLDLTTATLGPDAAYQLKENNTALDSDLTISKYIWNAATSELTTVKYDIVFENTLGDLDEDINYYYQWVDLVLDEGKETEYTIKQLELISQSNVALDIDHDLVIKATHQFMIFGNGPINHTETSENQGIDITSSLTAWTQLYDGVAIKNSGTLGNITGDFVYNRSTEAKESTSPEQGGAMSNRGTIGNITGSFIANQSLSNGSAISNFGGTIGDITADFIMNSAHDAAGTISNDGGGRIGHIKGDFLSNVTGNGGSAINNNNGSHIESITGDFIGNKDVSDRLGSGGGGAILNAASSYIGDIKGDFIDNFSADGSGAIFALSSSQIKSITGDFINNQSLAGAGAINLTTSATIGDIEGNFIGNIGSKEYSYSSTSGALNLFNATAGLLALNQSIELTGNRYIDTHGETPTTVSMAINMNNSSTLNLNTYAGNTITINDGISRGVINVNNGENGMGVSHGRSDYSTVEINNVVQYTDIFVHNGTLKLGEYDGTTLNTNGEEYIVEASSASLSSVELTVHQNGIVDAYSGAAIKSNSEIYNSGTVKYSQGELQADFNFTGTGKLQLTGTGTLNAMITATGEGNSITGVGSASKVSRHLTMNAGATLDLTNIALDADTYVANNASIADLKLNNSSITDVSTSTTSTRDSFYIPEGIDVYDMLNVGRELSQMAVVGSLTFDLDVEESVFETMVSLDSIAFRLAEADVDSNIFLENGEAISSIEELNILIDVNGTQLIVNDLYRDANNDLVLIIGVPEPSTATLSLLALAGLMSRRRRAH